MSPKVQPRPAMVWYDRLRYGCALHLHLGDDLTQDGHHERLVMDFPGDKDVGYAPDEYSLTALLAAPGTTSKREATVYLPAGTRWYTFTPVQLRGRPSINAAAPSSACRIRPSGSILRRTRDPKPAERTTADPLMLAGADGSFLSTRTTGSAGVLNGKYSRIPRHGTRRRGRLASRSRGSYPGMAGTRTIHLRWMRPGSPRALAFDAKPDATVTYVGKPVTVRAR